MDTPYEQILTVFNDDLGRIRECATEILQSCRDQFEADCLSHTYFEELWKVWVPKIYSFAVHGNHLSSNEKVSHEVLFKTLDDFICDGDSSIVFEQLSQMEKPPSVCCNGFKDGEPVYSCKECALSKTCFLCVDCFKNSEHRHHKYKMFTSGGAGCCDCGNTEIWKKDSFCNVHIAGIIEEEEEEQNKKIPDDLIERTKIVFRAILRYTYRLLNNEQTINTNRGTTYGIYSKDLSHIDSFGAVLYHNKDYTLDQVVRMLNRILKRNGRSFSEHATEIDREGRTIIKCSTYQQCSELKSEIEKYTLKRGKKSLKVLVTHTHIIAHQIYAQKLLFWIEKYLTTGKGFRRIFAEVILEPYIEESTLCEAFLLIDSSLWKTIRLQWHRLLISGLLLEYENKKALAKIFAKNYKHILKNFIQDDYDHTCSVSSLSVQLFTLPSLAHHLIAYDDILYILLDTLLSECSKKCNSAGKLEFEKRPVTLSFKRALYMLHDLRYLLSDIPGQWTDDLRDGFLRGISRLLQVFTLMQGMDAFTRQEDQHIEYEPEWKSGFKLQFKLSDSIFLATQWCDSDKIVSIEAYRLVLEKFEENKYYTIHKPGEVREPYSIHLPLTRFLAALFLSLKKFGLHLNSPELHRTKLTPVKIIKPVLNAQVMIAQTHTGMWRKNGNALLKSMFFYHNVDYRNEMLDRDITLLQTAATLMESNEFLIHVLNKFDLYHWIMPNLEPNKFKSSEDELKNIVSLEEEFLNLLIVIIGERYMPGVSNVTVKDRIRKEIIQHLCIKPLSHSELLRTLSYDLSSREAIVDEVIQEITAFRKSNHVSGKSVFELKAKYYDEYNAFFYHYTREELSKAEETQRKKRKAKEGIECCPPPKLPTLTQSFTMLVNLLQCDVMLRIMRTVLKRSIDLKAKTNSESQLHKVLHLIGYALQEEETTNYPFFKFIEKASAFGLFSLIQDIAKNSHVDAHKDLLKWILIKYQRVSNNNKENYNVFEKNTSPEKVDTEKERRTKLVAERKAKLIEQMQKMQNNFIKENSSLFAEASKKPRTSSEVETMDASEIIQIQPIALGPNQAARLIKEKSYICIICQEEEKVRAEGPSMVFAAFVQQASTLSQLKNHEILMNISKQDLPYLHSNLGPAPHINTCGHVMHRECWRRHFKNITAQEYRRLRQPDTEKHEFLCPLCDRLSNIVLPIIPSLTSLQPHLPKSDIIFDEWIENIYNTLSKTFRIFTCDSSIEYKSIQCNVCVYSSQASRIECKINCMQPPNEILYSYQSSYNLPPKCIELFPTQPVALDISHLQMIYVFAQTVSTQSLHTDSLPVSKRLAPMNWKSLAYTIHSIEVSLRDSNKPLIGDLPSRQQECIENFTRIVSVLSTTLSSSVFVNSHAMTLLSMLFIHENKGPSILQWDSFGFLISLTYSVPSLSCAYTSVPTPSGTTIDSHLLRIIFTCHIVKILILLKDDLYSSEDTNTENDTGLLEILEIIPHKTKNFSTLISWKYIQQACLPFLRCCVLFYHYLTEVPAPAALTKAGGDTFGNMCSYLDLPQNPKDLFNSLEVKRLVKLWCNHHEILSYVEGAVCQVIYEPRPVPHLIELPADYCEIINAASMFKCTKGDLTDPYVCLICGDIMCSCASDQHATICGGDVGVFLQIRNCEVLLVAVPDDGCFIPAPYLDDYGETDQGLCRGNRLTLCLERYDELQTLWLSHGVRQEIARSNNFAEMQRNPF